MTLVVEIEKATAREKREGVITLVVGKARPAGSGEGDRQGEGLDPASFEREFENWVARFGNWIEYAHPVTKAIERKWNGMYDTHQQPIEAELRGAWFFPDEQKARIKVKPADPQWAEWALSGRCSGASWGGLVAKREVPDGDR